MSYEARCKVKRMGFEGKRKVFRAVIEFPDGPPKWPFNVVWQNWDVLITPQPPGDAAAEAARLAVKTAERGPA